MPSVFAQIRDAERDGFTQTTAFRKAPTQITGANIWFDLSPSPGNPIPNYYSGPANSFKPLTRSDDGGLDHGGNVSPKQKHISLFELQSNSAGVPATFYVLDYLGFYGSLDQSITDIQPLDNTRPVPRYPTGSNVQIMPVAIFAQGGGQNFRVFYTNDKGVGGRVTPEHLMTTQGALGTVLSSSGAANNSRAPFMALQEGDSGVQRIDAIQFMGTGDIGVMALVLVKHIMRHSIRAVDAPVESTPIIHHSHLPVVVDDAYLNMIMLPSGSIQGSTIMGYMKTTWI